MSIMPIMMMTLSFWFSSVLFSLALFAPPRGTRAASSDEPELAPQLTFTLVLGIGISVVLLAIFGLLGYLWYRNRHPPPINTAKLQPRHIVLRVIIFFFKEIFLELVGLVFFIMGVVNFQLPPSAWCMTNGVCLDVRQIAIAFYIFGALKYALLIFEIVIGHFFKEIDEKITIRLYRIGIRGDWNALLAAIIFIPVIIIDGMILNAGQVCDQIGFSNIFPGDEIILTTLDTLLWAKLCLRLLLNLYSSGGNPPYDIKGFAYAMITYIYTLLLILLYIFVHLDTIFSTGMIVTTPMIIVLINVLTHQYVSSYTSMMAQGILSLDRALKGSKARINQLKIFLWYIRRGPIGVIFTLGMFAYTGYVYVSLWYITFSVAVKNQTGAIQGAIYVVVIFLDIFNAFFSWNYLYALTKRLGGWVRWCAPLPNCSTYAQAINTILSQCNANFRMDAYGDIR
eukprot:TRINITY_DN846_c0_g1_i5.p1 TRINITY_DN846_c0_g1~~TRINITY_DN846_c0_g1_i5.p1  ORF type:complete len:453 (-),score=78.73 TRINITY_DN846_c0_g1_i5:127-1485(-)